MAVQDYGLGRLSAPDNRDFNFLMATTLPREKPNVQTKYWYANGWWGNQEKTSKCVGYSWAHWVEDGPVGHKGIPPIVSPDLIYAEAQKIDEWEGECVDMETQCLEKTKGWINGESLDEGDVILTFDIEQDGLVWKEVEKVHLYNDKKYRIWSQKGFEKAVTDNHKWVVSNYNMSAKRYALIETINLKSQHEMLMMAKRGSLEQPKEETYNDDFIKTVAWAITEGYYRPHSRRGNGVCISQKKYFNHVNELLTNQGVSKGYKKSDGSHVWEIGGDLALDIREVAPNKAPTLEFLLCLTVRQLNMFIDECILGDGSLIRKTINRKQRKSFHQKTGSILDSFLTACVLAGYPLSRSSINKISKNPVETWTLKTSYHKECRHLKASEYLTGKVWCPQTECGTFVARRNGNIFITGNSYNGTSVRAGAKYLQDLGYIESYTWAWDLDTVINALLVKGPVVVGTYWYTGMFKPDSKGLIKVEGQVEGGHAYLLNGINMKKEVVRLKNSWGKGWGIKGHAYVSFEDLDRLINQNGECCLAIEKKVN